MNAHPYPQPAELPRSPRYRLFLDGREAPLLHTPIAAIGSFAFLRLKPIEVVIELKGPCPHHVVIRPLGRSVLGELDGHKLSLKIDRPGPLVIEFDQKDTEAIYLFADPPECLEAPANMHDWRVLEPGIIHTPARVDLEPGESLWLPPGAALRAPVLAHGSEHFEIRGPGLLLGDYQPARGVAGVCEGRNRPILQLASCRNARIRDLLILDSRAWTFPIVDCEHIRVTNHKSVTWSVCDDGIDIVGSRAIRIENSFISSRDDCIAVKAADYQPFLATDGRLPVHDIVVTGCVCSNGDCGNALEVGFETRAASISRVRFQDCDILRVKPEGNLSGAALSVHAGNHARIHDILFENLRIEEAMDKFIDMAIFRSPYPGSDDRIGAIEDVTIRNIQLLSGMLPRSFIRGLDAAHPINRVTIQNISLRGPKYRSSLNKNHGIPTTTEPHPSITLSQTLPELIFAQHCTALSLPPPIDIQSV